MPQEDLDDLIALVEDQHCMRASNPTFYMGSLTIITDKDGRVYYSGSEPQPLTLRMVWCGYTLEVDVKVDVLVAESKPPVWGFRFRPKFAGSFLVLDAIERSPQEGVDVGILWDFLYWHDFNLNVATGYRSAGLGVGYDLTSNFGAYGGYAFSFWTLKSNPQLGLYFGFW